MYHTKNIRPKGSRPFRVAMIYYKDIPICKITKEGVDYEEDEVTYVFEIIWSNYDEQRKLGMTEFSGIDETLRLKEYIRHNYMPSFLYTRMIPIDRIDWQDHYKTVGLEHHQDQWEFVMRKKGRCIENPLTVKSVDRKTGNVLEWDNDKKEYFVYSTLKDIYDLK